jgi:hypothetical protein
VAPAWRHVEHIVSRFVLGAVLRFRAMAEAQIRKIIHVDMDGAP